MAKKLIWLNSIRELSQQEHVCDIWKAIPHECKHLTFLKQDAVEAYIWASMYYGCVSNAVAMYILGVGWDVWSGRGGVILHVDW